MRKGIKKKGEGVRKRDLEERKGEEKREKRKKREGRGRKEDETG